MPATSSDIVRLALAPARRRILGLFGTKANPPAAEDGFDAYVLSRGLPDSPPLITRADSHNGLSPNVQIAQVCSRPQPFDMPFPAIVKDKSGHGWDLLLGGTWAVADASRFLTGHALALVAPGAALSKQVVESWIGNCAADRVRDAVRGQAIEQLRDEDALPARWWEKRLSEWLGPFGLAVKLTAARWESADAARAQEQRRRDEDLARLAEQRERERQAEVRELQAQVRYEDEKKRVEEDRRLSESQRSHELEVLERRRRGEVLAAEKQIEAMRWQHEKAGLEHAVQMARLRNDLASAESAKQRQADAEKEYQHISRQLATAQQTLERLAAVSEPILRVISGSDKARAFQAAERLTSPEFSVPASALAAMGFTVAPQSLVDLLKRNELSKKSPAVQLHKEELRTRDIGVAKVKALPIGSPLQFELTSARGGHVTVLNIGTSGTVYAQVPNAYRDSTAAVATKSQKYSIPGEELFPWDGDYREEGPPGWEHIAVIVSDAPLLAGAILARSTTDSPIVALSSDELEDLLSALADRPPAQWSAGVLSFLVG